MMVQLYERGREKESGGFTGVYHTNDKHIIMKLFLDTQEPTSDKPEIK